MIKALQLGEKVNHIYQIGNNIALKQYLSQERLSRELQGLEQWANLYSGIVPKKYARLNGVVFFEFLNNSNYNLPNTLKLNNMLVKRYTHIYDKFGYHNKSGAKFYQNWEYYLNFIFENLQELYIPLKSILTNKEFGFLTQSIDFLKKVDWKSYQKIPLHRDLHLGNILMTKSGLKIIDFEHYCIGPIEYEFANSIFWNDKESLDFKNILEKLGEKHIVTNEKLCYQLVSLYLLEQIKIALNDDDKEKIILLTKKYKTFLRRNINFLTTTNNPHCYEL